MTGETASTAKTGLEFINVTLKVVDELGCEVVCDNRQEGEIMVKGDTVTSGYWNLPEETVKALDHGWLRTGDLAVIYPEKYVTILDRKKDMIITGEKMSIKKVCAILISKSGCRENDTVNLF